MNVPARLLFLAAVAAAVAAALPAAAVITRLYPLSDIIGDADAIVSAQVAARDRKRQLVTLKRVRTLKGQAAWASSQIRLAGGDDRKQVPVIEARLTPGRQVLVFTKNGRFSLCYVEGTWFRVVPPADPKAPRQFVHLEPYLRRTYRGTSAELERVVAEVLAGKGTAPAPDPDTPPGVGPP
jgi:hypothetical protein